LSTRCVEVLEIMSDSIPDPFNVSPQMSASIAKFTLVLEDIAHALALLKKRAPLLHLNRNEGQLDCFNKRLDDVCLEVTMASTLRTEAKLSEIIVEVANTSTSFSETSVILSTTCTTLSETSNRLELMGSRIYLSSLILCVSLF